jgi:tetratricopeptide (TPR) repeat protein
MTGTHHRENQARGPQPAVRRLPSRKAPPGLFAFLFLAIVLAGCGRLQARLEMKEGNQDYLKGEYESAIRHYESAVAHVPDLPQGWLNQAYSYVALSRAAGADLLERKRLADKAVAAFQKYIEFMDEEEEDEDGESDPERPGRERVDQHILTLYLDSGEVDKAIAFLEERLERDPRDLPALQMLSTISADRGDLASAANWQRKRLAFEPDEPETHYAFGVFAWRASYYNQTTDLALRDSLVDEGIAELETALRLQPDYFEALSYMTLLYREKAKNATDPAEIALAETKAQEYRRRAMEARKGQSPDETPADGTDASEPPVETSGSLLGRR